MNYTLKVAEIRKETEDTITLCFKQPGLKKIRYAAGQYLTLIFRINGRRYIRPYSFSSCFGVDAYLEITVKRVLNGIVSNHILDCVKIGDSVEVMPPMGDFIVHEVENILNIYLWGVGSGITPLISIAKSILTSKPSIIVHLNYGNRSNESTIFKKLIDSLKEEHGHRFIVRHFHTQLFVNENNPYVIQGRIDRKKAIQILSGDKDIQHSVHYICGPSGLKESVKSALADFSVDSNSIFSEDFELVKNPKDFEDIETRIIKLKFNDEIHKLEVVKGKSILESALNSNIELPYSCQTGNCSTCRGKLIDGELKMIGLTKDRDDLLENEFLLCCSYPITNNVHVEI